jgi:hypothetical protein
MVWCLIIAGITFLFQWVFLSSTCTWSTVPGTENFSRNTYVCTCIARWGNLPVLLLPPFIHYFIFEAVPIWKLVFMYGQDSVLVLFVCCCHLMEGWTWYCAMWPCRILWSRKQVFWLLWRIIIVIQHILLLWRAVSWMSNSHIIRQHIWVVLTLSAYF